MDILTLLVNSWINIGPVAFSSVSREGQDCRERKKTAQTIGHCQFGDQLKGLILHAGLWDVIYHLAHEGHDSIQDVGRKSTKHLRSSVPKYPRGKWKRVRSPKGNSL